MTVSYVLSPIGNGMQFFDDTGVPLAGGLLSTYAAGSSTTQQATYTGITNSAPANSNPIVLDSAGRVTTEIWLMPNSGYNFVLTKADGSTVLMSCDNIYGSAATSQPYLPDPTGQSGKFLTTNGTSPVGDGLSWATPSGGGGGGGYPIFVAQLYTTSNGTFDGTWYNAWNYVPEISSTEAHWDTTANVLTLDATGWYRIEVAANAAGLSSWPNQATTYGTWVQGALPYFNTSVYSKSAIGDGGNNDWTFINPSNPCWTDVFFVQVVTAPQQVLISTYAEMYNGGETFVDFNAAITAQRITNQTAS